MGSLSAALRAAIPMPIGKEVVVECARGDALFRRVWRNGLSSIAPRERRGRLCVEIGLVAEAAATPLLQAARLDVFAQLTGAGAHGVDLLTLTPAGQVLAVEVKGTMRPGGVPRLGRSRIRQMSVEWLSSPENPAMIEWDLTGEDIYGGVALIDFGAMQWRAAVTGDHDSYVAVTNPSQLLDLTHLDGR